MRSPDQYQALSFFYESKINDLTVLYKVGKNWRFGVKKSLESI